MKISKNNVEKREVYTALIMLIIVIGVMLLKQQNSPLYAYNRYQDLQIYTVVSRAVRNGQVLYKEAFDHKGPLLFFFGTVMYYNSFTVWVVDIITTFVQCFTQYKIVKHVSDEQKAIVCQSVTLLQILAVLCDCGAPEQIFLMLMYIQIYLLVTDRNDKYSQLLYGIMVTFVFYTKINIVQFWVPIFIYLFYRQIREKKLRENLIYAFTPFVVTTVGILAYFIYNDALYDFWNQYFVLNVKYSEQVGDIIQKVVAAVIVLVILIEYILLLRKHKTSIKICALQLVFVAVAQIGLSSHLFLYYFLCIVPITLFIFFGKQSIGKPSAYVLCAFVAAIAVYSSLESALSTNSFLAQKDSDIRWQFYQDVKNEVEDGTFYGVQTIYFIQYNLAEYLPYNPVKYSTYCNMNYECNPDMYEYTYKAVSDKSIEYIAILMQDDYKSIIQTKLVLKEQETHIKDMIMDRIAENYSKCFIYTSDDLPDGTALVVFRANVETQ